MTGIIPSSNGALLALPELPIVVRPAIAKDLPFIDGLQKLHTKMVGWMPTATLEGKISAGHVLIAEEFAGNRSVGYCIGHDQYFKHDDVGIIYQLNVLPGKQRGLIGALLLRSQFERSAYGCKLYCCWCAQDIAANHFWEAMGFVPLAFRAGSEKRSRVHIFWQKRIRQGDTTTPWWFPSKTAAGSIREDRIVLPIPPGTHWSDAKPLILPALSGVEGPAELPVVSGQLSVAEKKPRAKKPAPVEKPKAMGRNGLMFDIPKRGEPVAAIKQKLGPKPKPTPKRKNDPRLVAAARELRDRWLEEVNSGRHLPESLGKYEVSRVIRDARATPTALLDAA